MSQTEDPQIAALLREREGYVRYGKDDRVASVDAELKRRGYEAEKPVAVKKSAAPKDRAGRESRQSSAD